MPQPRRITYKTLLNWLNLLSDDQLNSDVTVEDGNEGECYFGWLEVNQNDSLDEDHPVIYFDRNTEANERTDAPPDFLRIGGLHRLPFIGEMFFGLNSKYQTTRLIIGYSADQIPVLIVENNTYSMNQINFNELLSAIKAAEIDPKTCYFPNFTLDTEPKFTK